jgi:cholesterol transport system auxiliary component
MLWLAALLLLSACALPERAPAPQRYDFGPATVSADADAPAARPVLALRVQSSAALEGTAMLYRLAYADAQQLRAYAQSRWVMAPAELLQQRLRAGLARHYTLPPPGEGGARLLYIELEEFSQQFTAPAESHGLLRLRASVVQRTATGDQLLAQRELQLQQPAASADAPGGVRALAAASDAAVAELVQWLQALR